MASEKALLGILGCIFTSFDLCFAVQLRVTLSVTMCTQNLTIFFLFIDVFSIPSSDLEWVFIFLVHELAVTLLLFERKVISFYVFSVPFF